MIGQTRILVFQHIACEHPGIFREFLAADRVDWQAVELDAGEPIPSLTEFDALWVMGGLMDVWQEERNPWLVAEKQAIAEAVGERRMPFFGLCLGHQLLADALGGEVGPGEPEIGVMPIEQTAAGATSPFLESVPQSLPALQWHGAEVKTAPEDAVVLMSSPVCPVQAMSIGDYAFSVQFHVEMTPTTVREWGEIPEYRKALEDTLGPGALEDIDAQAGEQMPLFNNLSRQLYENWKSTVFD